ncbi:MAG TPA: PA14 domain-containing protein [Abditibacteriaceae bacterium]|jgi:lysophospholipase L1-like esterase
MASSAPGATTPGATAQSQGFFFHNGDRPILFLGDSITEQRMYTTFIEAYVLTRFPTWNVQFRNVGWSGDAAPLWQRGSYENGMKRDILPLKPAAITIDFGMNDARGGEVNYNNYINYSTRLARDLKAAGARVALITPSPEEKYEVGQPGGSAYNNMLWKYSQGLKQVAAQEGVLFVDQYTPFINVINLGRAAGVLSTQAGGARLIPDAVHPNWAGHLVMASSILKGLGAPSLVSRVEVDGRIRRASTQGAQVQVNNQSNPPRASGGVAVPDKQSIVFTRTDAALPWPIPTDAALALRIPGYTPLEDLSRYELRVTNLSAPRYELSIDGERVGAWTREELASGINLSQQAGPISAQAQRLFQKIIDKNNLYFARWRQVQIFQAPAWLQTAGVETARSAELARLDAQIAALESEINTLRKPVPHVWQLSPAAPAIPTEVQMNGNANGVRLSWRDNASDEQGYLIERSLDGIQFTPVARTAANASSFRDTAATSTRPVYYRIRAFDAVATSAPSSTASNAWAGTGLKSEYFNSTDFSNLALTRTDPRIDFDWSTAAPAAVVNANNFSVRWMGQVQPKSSGIYRFTSLADDGVRVWVNGRLIIDNWQDQAPTESFGTVTLETGKKYDIKVEYYQGAGGAVMKLFWQGPGQSRELIPQTQLYSAP